MKQQKIMVTSALPYANGPIHLGHIAGAYLPADVYVRFQRLIGNDAVYICGTDEHGVPITLRAEQEKVTPRTIVKRYHDDIKRAFERFNIVFDNFSGTSQLHNKHHANLSREFFTNLMNNDYISTHLSDQHFCKNCNRYLPDRFIQGTCPKCGNEEARGDECSRCNHQFEPIELKNPKCRICSNIPDIKASKHWYFRLDVLQKALENWLDTKTDWKENVLNFVRGWFKQGLKERAITRDLYWGVPVPLEDAAGKVLYVWFDAPIGYISATMQWAENKGEKEKWREYWQNPDCKILHFIGKDNIPFHTIIWPAMLIGQKQNYQLPWNVPANEFLTFGLTEAQASDKASKSKGNVVWVHDALDNFPADMLRYYLAANAPEKNDSVFTWKDFQKKCNSELLNVLGNFANRVLKFIEKNFESKIPQPVSFTPSDQQILSLIQSTMAKVHTCFENFEVRNAISEIVSLGRAGNQYFDEKAPWKSLNENKEDCQNCMYVSAQIVNAICVMLYPVIPQSAQKLWEQIGHKGSIVKWDQGAKELPGGHSISVPSGLFNKVEDEMVAVLEKKLGDALAGNSTPKQEESKTEASSEISLEDFKRIEIKIGEILEAQRVPKAKKLLQLKVKIGEEIRTLVSGIAQDYEPEQLPGKKVPILVNLKPAKICGVESQGMVLCANLDGHAVLMHPDKDVPSGSLIT